MRALEVIYSTNKPFQISKQKFLKRNFNIVKVGLQIEREIIRRIKQSRGNDVKWTTQ